MSGRIDLFLENVSSAAIAGHVNPDGDCIGSTCALYQYITRNFPQLRTDLYLEETKSVFSFLRGTGEALRSYENQHYDVLFLLDTSSPERIGVSGELIRSADKTVCIDHHISNPGFADFNIIEADSSSASELLFTLLDPDKIDAEIAASIYTGIVHDTGVFQYTCTTVRTMETAAKLLSYKIPFSEIIENTFNMKTIQEQRVLGHVLENSELYCGGKCVYGHVTREEMDRNEVSKRELDGIVSQLRMTQGAEASVFLYPNGEDSWKASLRSREYLDVSRIGAVFGGGGHVRAAGCTINAPYEEAKKQILDAVCIALE